MNKILELREKRAKLWESAKAFLDARRDDKGLVSAEDTATYERMEQDVVDLGKEIDRLEKQAVLDLELSKPTSTPLSNKPNNGMGKIKEGRASDEYKKAFWNVMRTKNPKSEVFNSLSIGDDTEGGYLVPADLKGRVCYGGLDLSSSTDITAFVLVFPPEDEDDKYSILPYFWIPEENIDLRVRRDHVNYDLWEKQGFIKTTDGNVVHYGFIENFIEELGMDYNIREIAFDRWGAVQMTQNLEGMGFTVVPFGQGFKDMSPPTKELMKLTLEEKLAHGGHPVLRWMMDNIFVRTDPAGNIKPDKEKSSEKIDGAVATIMALDRALRNDGVSTGSVYDERGILVF